MPVPTPSWAVRNGLNAEFLDALGQNPADAVTYDNASSGLTADQVQAAIDELAAAAGSVADILDLPTAETDTTLVLSPDGVGGVTFRAETGGTGTGIYVNVMDYGAVGDGTTDDTTAIQDACDAITAGSGGIGGTLFFPRGTYKITAQIDVNAAIHFLGEGGPDGAFSVIHQVTHDTSAFVGVAPPYDMSFEDLWIQGATTGSLSTDTSGDGIYSPRNIHAINLRVDGFYNGVRIGNLSFYSKLINCLFLWNANAGVHVHQDANNASFLNVRSAFNKYGYVFVGGGSGGEAHRIIGGATESNTTAGIVVDGDAGTQQGAFVVRDQYFEANGTSIQVGATTGVVGLVVEGCWFVNDDTGWHIDLLAGDRATIIGNTFQASGSNRDVRQNAAFDNVALVNNAPSSATSYSLQADAIVLDPGNTTAASAVGAAAAGTSPFLARLDHGHALGGTVGGDLSGTLPNPSVVDDSHNHTAATLPATGGGMGSDHEHMIDVFSGDGATTVFELTDEPLDPEEVFAFVAGAWTAVAISGAMNTVATFGSAPASGSSNVVIQYPAVAA